MDPITTAIVAALAAGVAGGINAVSKAVIVDSYNALKTVVRQKLGHDSDLAEAIDKLEQRPDSKNRQGVLQEEVEVAQADKDPDILRAAQYLLTQLRAEPGGEQHIQSAVGGYIAQADRGGTASVKINQSKK